MISTKRDRGSNPTETEFSNKDGWYIQLNGGGEKSLSSPVIFNNKVFFTTSLKKAAFDI